MGAWGAGSFQNDWALDWVGDLCESGDAATVRDTLIAATHLQTAPEPSIIGRMLGRKSREPRLPAHVASEALAAAEIVAFWLGHPTENFPDKLRNWATERKSSFTPELAQLAREAVLAIKSKSDLKDLWEEGDGIVAHKWRAAIADLEQRLQN